MQLQRTFIKATTETASVNLCRRRRSRRRRRKDLRRKHVKKAHFRVNDHTVRRARADVGVVVR